MNLGESTMANKRSFEINWGMLIFGVAVIAATWFVPRMLESSRSTEEPGVHAAASAVPAPE